MSYEILYRSIGIKVNEKVLLISEMGSNNLYEYSGKRARSFSCVKMFGLGTFLTKEEIVNNIKQVQTEIETNPRYEHKGVESFGYNIGISMYGKRTHTTSLNNVISFFKKGFDNSLTIEEFKEIGINFNFSKYGGNIIYIDSTEDLLNNLHLLNEDYWIYSINDYPIDWFFNRIKSKKKRRIPNPNRIIKEKKFIVSIGGGYYFCRKTKYGFKYGSSVNYCRAFETEKQAEKIIPYLKNMGYEKAMVMSK